MGRHVVGVNMLLSSLGDIVSFIQFTLWSTKQHEIQLSPIRIHNTIQCFKTILYLEVSYDDVYACSSAGPVLHSAVGFERQCL